MMTRPATSVAKSAPTRRVWPFRTSDPKVLSSPPTYLFAPRRLVISQTFFPIESGKTGLIFLSEVVSTRQRLLGSLRSPPRVAKDPPTESMVGDRIPTSPLIQTGLAKVTPVPAPSPVTETLLNRDRPSSIVVA